MRGTIAIGVGLLALSALLSSCSKDDGGNKPSSASAGSGGSSSGAGGSNAGGGAGGTGGSYIVGPAISSAPPAWVRPADCQGIGNLCPNLAGCEAGSTCQLEGNVCIPALEPGAMALPSKSMERPYCAAYTCMTFEQASCFCTGDAGKTDPRCESPEALAGLCQAEKWSCDATKKCCGDLSCVDHGGTSVCEKACTSEADCESGCCTDRYDTGVKVCAEKAACDNPCKKRGEACMPGSATMANDCCRGSCIQSESPEYAGCRPNCKTGPDCDTGCCIPFSNTDDGFCVDALYCTCLNVGQQCGVSRQECCEGTTCAGQPEAFFCAQLCTLPTDCPSGCCRALSDGSKSICEPADHCPP